jgi:hypothetical protein
MILMEKDWLEELIWALDRREGIVYLSLAISTKEKIKTMYRDRTVEFLTAAAEALQGHEGLEEVKQGFNELWEEKTTSA